MRSGLSKLVGAELKLWEEHLAALAAMGREEINYRNISLELGSRLEQAVEVLRQLPHSWRIEICQHVISCGCKHAGE